MRRKKKLKIERKEFEIDMYGIYLTLAELSKATGIDTIFYKFNDMKKHIELWGGRYLIQRKTLTV